MNDNEFIRGSVPMTKAEVRAVALSKLELKDGMTVWDVGAGTGSVTVEVARQCPHGHVFAFEKKEEALALIEQNCAKHGVSNVTLLPGDALERIPEAGDAHRIFVGGGGKDLERLLQACTLKPGGRIVIACITLESALEAVESCTALKLTDVSACQIAVSHLESLGGRHYYKPQNPVTIVCGRKE